MGKVHAICFDVFGTLIVRERGRISPYMRLARGTERLPFMTRNVGVEDFAEELGLSHLVPVMQHELGEELQSLRLYSEVDQVIRQLRARGKRIAVCSNLAQAYGPAVRDLLPGLDGYSLSYEVGAAKPDPAIYQNACAILGSRPRDVLFVGDSRRCDFEGPQKFGMQARLIDRSAGETLIEVLAGVI